ncbi:MAG TPA: enolase C-terminal domain-like protein [Roseiarcus sp.]
MRSIRTRAVRSPMRRPLLTSVGSVTAAPLVLIDVETDQGITGRSYLFCYLDAVSPLIRRVLEILVPSLVRQKVEPAELRKRAGQSLQLLGVDGVFGLCLSGLDVAYWDALAKAADMPLARFLGASCGRIQAYNSNGLGVMNPEAAASEALELLDDGYRAIKVRLGHPAAEDDLAVVRAIRAKIPAGALLMSDYNHCLSGLEAVRRARMLDDEGLYWIEEPTAPDDLPANAEVARSVSTPIQIGENFRTLREMQAAIDQRACDLVMPDLERIGGVSGWLKAAAVAETSGFAMSSHLFPEVSSHLMMATPTNHWLEYVDWAGPILSEPLVVRDGYAIVPERSGNGLSWDEDAVRLYGAD